MEYANWLGFLRSRKLTSFSSFLPAVHFAWLCYCPASVSGPPYPHISLFADFRSECSVPSASTHPSLSLGPAVPPGTLSCSFFSPLVSGRKCQYLLAALWAAPRCQPLWCSPQVAVNYSQLPSLLLGLAKVFFIPAKCLIFRKLLDGCRWIFIPHELCPFWTTTKPTHVEKLGCKMPTKNLGGVLKL